MDGPVHFEDRHPWDRSEILRTEGAGLLFVWTEVREQNIILGQSSHSRWHEMLYGSLTRTLLRELRTIDILLVAAPNEVITE